MKNENKVVIANVEKVNKETALPNFNSGIVVVDDINIQKKLFHYTFIGPTKAKISLVWLITKKRGRK